MTEEVRAKQKFKADEVMTPEEYAAKPIIGWHQVCRDFDGFENVGVRFGAQETGLLECECPSCGYEFRRRASVVTSHIRGGT
jgi:hypothetical protein